MIHYVWNETFQKPMPKLIRVNIPSKNYVTTSREVQVWLEENCQHPFYILPNWLANGVEFEDDRDATLFVLRWS